MTGPTHFKQHIDPVRFKTKGADHPEADGEHGPFAQSLLASGDGDTHVKQIFGTVTAVSGCDDRFFSVAEQRLGYMPIQRFFGDILGVDFGENEMRVLQCVVDPGIGFQIFFCSGPAFTGVKINNEGCPVTAAVMYPVAGLEVVPGIPPAHGHISGGMIQGILDQGWRDVGCLFFFIDISSPALENVQCFFMSYQNPRISQKL